MRHTSKLILIAFALAFLFSSCSPKSDKENIVLKEMISSIEASNINLNKSSETSLKSLEDKLNDPATAERAKLWNAKAQDVSTLSKEIYNYITELKGELKKASTKEDEDSEKSFDPTNRKAVNKILFDDKRGEELIIKMKNHRENLFNLDSSIRLAFQDSYPFPVEKSADYYFKGATILESVAFLARMQNNVKVIENRMIAFCYYKVPDAFCGFGNYYSAIIGQSSNIVKPGDGITITAGVGSFSKAALPRIFINNKMIDINERGVAEKDLKVSNKPGKYSVPVKIIYSDQDGLQQIIEERLEYTVSDYKTDQ
jgi:hypothetical protein